MNYTRWEELIDLIFKKTNIKFENDKCHKDHYGLSIGGKLPFSISEYEFNYMREFIINNKLKNGYELATGIGVSSISIAQGLKVNGGKLITVDSYLEEESQIQPIMNNSLTKNNGFDRNIEIFKSLDLMDTVKAYRDYSPNCLSILDNEFNNNVDFVFFDCPKSKEDFIRDAADLKSRLNESKFAIFVHDTHCYHEEFIELSNSIFDIEPEFIYDFKNDKNNIVKQVFPLALITNIK